MKTKEMEVGLQSCDSILSRDTLVKDTSMSYDAPLVISVQKVKEECK